MKIKVEQRHIDNGIPRSAYNCPVALTIREDLSADKVQVTAVFVTARNRNDIEFGWYDLPKDMVSFITNFDSGVQVNPAEFEVKGLQIIQWV